MGLQNTPITTSVLQPLYSIELSGASPYFRPFKLPGTSALLNRDYLRLRILVLPTGRSRAIS
jgi:hypothetical protein